MTNKLFIIAVLLMSGCTTSYKHLSNPSVSNDGYDLVCGGIEKGYGQLVTEVDVCKNLAPNGGEFVFAEIKYRWGLNIQESEQ